MKKLKKRKKPIRIGWQYLPRKKKKKAKKLLEMIMNRDYDKLIAGFKTSTN